MLKADKLDFVIEKATELGASSVALFTSSRCVARPAADDEDRNVLGVGPGDGIHHVVAAGAVGDAHDPDAPGGTSVPVRREADARLVREGDHAQAAPAPEAGEQPQDEIAGNAEDVRDAELVEVGDQEVAEAHGGAHDPTGRTPRRRRSRR